MFEGGDSTSRSAGQLEARSYFTEASPSPALAAALDSSGHLTQIEEEAPTMLRSEQDSTQDKDEKWKIRINVEAEYREGKLKRQR